MSANRIVQSDGRPEAGPVVDELEDRTRQIGRELFEQAGRGSNFWERDWWDDRLMSLTMSDSSTRVQLFRFIDALPMLQEPGEVRRHLEEYLQEAGEGLPKVIAWPLGLVPGGNLGDRTVAAIARSAATRMAHRFIAGSTPNEALRAVLELRDQKIAFTVDPLGEAIISQEEADAYQSTCIDLIRGLAGPLDAQGEIPLIDRDDQGPIPRANLSLKLTSLTPRFDPVHAEATTASVLDHLRPIFRIARNQGAYVHVDMEQYAYKDLTFAIFRQVLEEPEFRDWSDVGIVCQTYLRDSLTDLQELRDWAERRGTPITVRLVKGAYWDYEVTFARQVGWPVPVFQEKWETDANFERCTDFLMQNAALLRPALGSHNIRSLAHAIAKAEALGLPKSAFEIQMLYGMGETFQRALVDQGFRVRVYTPYGAMLPGMAYLVRRLLENTSNESFLLASSAGEVPVEDLLRQPEEVGAMFSRRSNRATSEQVNDSLPPFRNEPPTDFSREENRQRLQQAIESVRGRLGLDLPLVIGGREVRTTERLESRDPGMLSRLVGQTARAGAEHVDQAIQAAREAFPDWAKTPPKERAAILMRAAAILRERKAELSAWEVFECAKPWREADGDIAEAIDFCEFYAREMIRLASPEHRDVPGETNAQEYIPRGVAAVIPPWNFPLAIPCGMTAAALVTGNTVILKPAEQSPVVAWQLFQVFQEAGLPDGALNYLPGLGEEAGAPLVADPRVDLIAFTGSREVGLAINQTAAEPKPGQDHIKRVIAEMGGKNAIIIDDDADLDEAVVGVLQSAFGYAGQKCSACSRAIVLEGVYDAFLTRLVEAARALPIGHAEEPETVVNPLIDTDARARVLDYQHRAEQQGKVAFRLDVGGLAAQGNYVSPMIVSDVDPESSIAQEEIFGPLLALIRAKDLDEAIQVANNSRYALTGGLYSRSPANIDRVKREFLVGNLYINRVITGALVARQPFGGFKLSGTGTKAGGSDYLREFLLPRTITENTLRRGFAPEPETEAQSGEVVQASMGI